MTTIDTCFLEAKPVKLPSWSKVHFLLVGCGGTGSALASAVGRLLRLLTENGKQARATFIDPDYVEPKNISRQQFCDAEVNKPKALVLAARCSMAWGVEITGVVKPFDPAMAENTDYSEIKIILGCVDNGAARQAIAESLTRANSFRQVPRTWWLDGGNSFESGQVLLGSTTEISDLTHLAFPENLEICAALPSPHLVHPELLKEEIPKEANLSCAEMAVINSQSLSINARVASEMHDYLLRLLSGNLKRFATYFDCSSGCSKSLYTTPRQVLTGINQ